MLYSRVGHLMASVSSQSFSLSFGRRLRAELAEVDREILERVARRRSLAAAIGESKVASGRGTCVTAVDGRTEKANGSGAR